MKNEKSIWIFVALIGVFGLLGAINDWDFIFSKRFRHTRLLTLLPRPLARLVCAVASLGLIGFSIYNFIILF